MSIETETAANDQPPRMDRRERVVSILIGLGVVVGVAAAIGLLVLAKAGLTLVAIALFLALALNPAVEFFMRRGLGRGSAVGAVYVLALVVLALVGLVLIPPLVKQVTELVRALPGLVADLTQGRGPLGFLERRYHVVEEVRRATARGGLSRQAAPALDVVKGFAATVIGAVIIAFLTLFMLLEGPQWRRRLTGLLPDRRRPQVERVGAGVYRAVGGFVTGNVLASLLAGLFATIVMLVAGVPYAFPLGLFVAIVELVPYIGPAVATLLVSAVALTQGLATAIVVFALLLVYHMIEGHSVRPLIYGRAVRLSPLAVLIAILLGTEIAGILGALAAIPVAGSIQVAIGEVVEHRRESRAGAAPAAQPVSERSSLPSAARPESA